MHPTPAPPKRQRQADRTAQMQSRIIGAAIKVLCDKGYPAATVKTIAAQAGVSVGALQHQFETKARLMAAVLIHLFNARKAHYRRAIETVEPVDAVARMTSNVWGALHQPEFLAMVEIALARRSDPDLDAEIAAPLARIEQVMERWTVRLWRSAGIAPDLTRLGRRMTGAFLTGLAVRVASGMENDPEALVAGWSGMLGLFHEMPALRARLGPQEPAGGT